MTGLPHAIASASGCCSCSAIPAGPHGCGAPHECPYCDAGPVYQEEATAPEWQEPMPAPSPVPPTTESHDEALPPAGVDDMLPPQVQPAAEPQAYYAPAPITPVTDPVDPAPLPPAIEAKPLVSKVAPPAREAPVVVGDEAEQFVLPEPSQRRASTAKSQSAATIQQVVWEQPVKPVHWQPRGADSNRPF